MVEKPKPAEAPSNLTITGRYILQPEIFELLGKQAAGAGGEIQLTDAMVALARTQPFYGLKFEGRSFDCGSKIGFLTANVAYALERQDIAPEFRAELRGCSAKNSVQQTRLALPAQGRAGKWSRCSRCRIWFERSQFWRPRL